MYSKYQKLCMMSFPNKPQFIVLFFSIFLLASCSVNQSVQHDYTYLYDDSKKIIKPSFKIFHFSEDSTKLFFQIRSDDILYGKLGKDTTLTARILCKYILYGPKGKKIIDSATIPFFNYNNNAASRLLQSSLKMPASLGERLPLEVRFRDEYRDLNVVNYLWLDKRENGNAQYYLLKDKDKVLFNNKLQSADSIQLYKSKLMPDGTYILESSETEFKMAAPPFSREKEMPKRLDQSSIRKLIFINDSIQLTTWGKINKVKPSIGDFQGYFFYSFYDGFPEITTYSQMIPPLRYISTSSEFQKLQEAVDKKKAVDAFWLKMADSEAKAKKMIKAYYDRVMMANKMFTDYREGWKSDRGIIYIVYGQPSRIYKDLNTEKWVYGEENNLLSISFMFIRRDSYFGNNHFQMQRKEEYKNNWYRRVDDWRQGKIY